MTRILSAPEIQSIAPPWMPSHDDEPLHLHEFFERAARRWPERVAIETPPASGRPERRTITYAELDRRVNDLAFFLREFIKEECVIAILLPRNSEHLYLAQLAVLKAGAAYTCIDPIFPDEQIGIILGDSQAICVLTDAAGAARIRSAKHDIECLLDVVEWTEQLPEGMAEAPAPAPWLTPSSLAYIIYTSGTTGRPKGVMIEHRSIANLVRADLHEVGVRPSDRVGQSASPAYDSSVEETWYALAAGATLVVIDDEATRLGPDLIAWLRRERITLFAPTPTLLRMTGCENPETELPALRLIHIGGEALPADIAERWSRGRRFVNDYGPTETTVTALRGVIQPGRPITIGRPLPGMKAWVLNERLEPVKDGEQGELCLGGIGLARGYMNEVELTTRKFPVHPRLGRIYRTGDLVHRGADGNYHCHGRIDAQVKVRGYRIELEAIESRLTECAGVRAAACRVQGESGQQKIGAFIVAEDPAAPPCFESLKSDLRSVLAEYMVPSYYQLLDRLPTGVSGKLDRKALPIVETQIHEINGHVVAPRNRLEEKLTAAFQAILRLDEPVSVDDDFFRALGGDSLLAAQLISRLRDDPATATLAVRDLYEARTVAELAKRTHTHCELNGHAKSETRNPKPASVGRPILATIVQTLWLVLGLILGAPLAYGLVFLALPALAKSLGWILFILLMPAFVVVGVLAYAALTIGSAVLAKRILIGRYRPLRAPVWGNFYVRNWMVLQVVRLVPWRMLEGTMLQQMVLRALGARIGQRVHIHRGVNLMQGGWDLLAIGDDVTLSQDASVRLVELEAGQIVVGPVTLESGCTLETRAGVASHTHVEGNAQLTALSFLPRGNRIPRGQRWDGIPAKPAGDATSANAHLKPRNDLSPAWHGLAMIAGRIAVGGFVALPLEVLGLLFVLIVGIDAEGGADWIFASSFDVAAFFLGLGLVALSVPLTLLFQCLAMRMLGRVPEGVISRWSLDYVRVWLKTGIVESASRWLSGTLLWPVWLRVAGMKIGKGCEISTIIDTIPELVEIGAETFFADGIYLGGPRIHQGVVLLASVRLGKNTFLGNHALVAAGQSLPDDVLLGVSTVADDTIVRSGTSWFGQPPFELPTREVVECDRSLTHDPTWGLYLGRVFWELLRFTLPLAPVLLGIVFVQMLIAAERTVSLAVLLLGVLPALELAFVASLFLLVLGVKWLLLGRVRPGMHPLWSSWCCRWDFHYVVWDFLGLAPLTALEGTLLLNWYLRAMGTRIGRHVVLGEGFAHVVDPDMLSFEDGATVTCQFQAHTFEDRVLKIDHVLIREQATVGHLAVLLYGAEIGERTDVLPHSVVMKRERLLADRKYAGCPTQPQK